MNSFDLLRLLAALAVIHHHSRVLAGKPATGFFHLDLGALGVGVFFVISGYLVTASLQRSTGIRDYILKRVLRIEPALVVCVALTALVLGACVTRLPLADYFTRPQVYLYVLGNSLIYPVTYGLPGVFDQNPVSAVNPSLWTLRLEFTCYLGLAALGAAGLLRKGVVAGLAGLAAAVTGVLTFLWSPPAQFAEAARIVLVAAQFGFLFLAGAYLQLRARPPPLWSLASLVFIATPLWGLALPAAVVLAGELRGPRLPADVSYGLYIYASPVQQTLALMGGLSFLASVALTLPLAAASWFLVERPALRLKGRLSRGPAVAATGPGPAPR